MKVMLCVPIEINVDTTRRKDIREAVRARLDDRNGMLASLDECAILDTFVVRAPEAPSKVVRNEE